MDKTATAYETKTVVCITDQRRCDRIIRAGRAVADMYGAGLSVISVVRPGRDHDTGSIEYLFAVSKENGAEMVLLYSDDVARAIIRYIKDNKVSSLLTGVPAAGDPVAGRVWSRFSHIKFFVVGDNGGLREIANPALAARMLAAPKPQNA